MPTLNDSTAAWLESARPLIRPLTFRDYSRAARRWCQTHGERYILELDEADLAILLGPAEYSSRTRQKELRYLRVFFNWARRRYGLGQGLTIDAIRQKNPPPRSIRTITETEYRALYAAAGDHPEFRPYLAIALETGLRRRTILSMRWCHVDTIQWWLRLPGSLLKSDRDLEVPLSEEAKRGFLALSLMGPVHPDYRCFSLKCWQVTRLWTRAARRAGIKARLHDLRKTFISRAAWKGVPIEVVMQLSDHRSLETVLGHYRQVRPEELLRAVGRKGSTEKGAAG